MPTPSSTSTAVLTLLVAGAFALSGCAATSPGTDDELSTAEGAQDAPVVTAGCPDELVEAYASTEGTTLEVLDPSEFDLTGIDADILATACVTNLTLDTLHAQTAFFPGDADEITAAINSALAAAGYTPEPDAPTRWFRGTDTQWVVTPNTGADFESFGFGEYPAVVSVSEDLHE